MNETLKKKPHTLDNTKLENFICKLTACKKKKTKQKLNFDSKTIRTFHYFLQCTEITIEIERDNRIHKQ